MMRITLWNSMGDEYHEKDPSIGSRVDLKNVKNKGQAWPYTRIFSGYQDSHRS